MAAVITGLLSNPKTMEMFMKSTMSMENIAKQADKFSNQIG